MHAICCEEVYHSRATELEVATGNDQFCPSCAVAYQKKGTVVPSDTPGDSTVTSTLPSSSPICSSESLQQKAMERSHHASTTIDLTTTHFEGEAIPIILT